MTIKTDPLTYEQYENFKGGLKKKRARMVNLISFLQSGNVDSVEIVQAYRLLGSWRNQLNIIAAIPGITTWVQTEESDPGYDIVTEIAALVADITSSITWIETNFPTGAGGYILSAQLTGGDVIYREFTPAQTAGLRVELQGIVDLIEP